MGFIRPLEQEDIPQVADLYNRVFRRSDRPASKALQCHLKEVFFNNPWFDKSPPSLVYHENDDKIVGFLGVLPRHMSINGNAIQVAYGSRFMVAPERRSTLAGLHLMKKFFAGPQDLSIGDGNNFTRKIWENLGGTTAIIHSFNWARPLCPTLYLLDSISRSCKESRMVTLLASALRPFCNILDGIAAKIKKNPFRSKPHAFSEHLLDQETLLTCLPEISSNGILQPVYDSDSLEWLLKVGSQKKIFGNFEKVVLRNMKQEIIGWFLYYLVPGGIGQVIQIGARNGSIGKVIDHLFYHASQRGAIALHGKLEPYYTQEFRDRSCLFYQGEWLLVDSKRPELIDAVCRGDACLSRLESDWCT